MPESLNKFMWRSYQASRAPERVLSQRQAFCPYSSVFSRVNCHRNDPLTYAHLSRRLLGHIINIEIKVLVHTGLEAERSYNSRRIVLLSGFYVFFSHLKDFVKKRFTKCRRVMSADRIFRSELVRCKSHLLRGRKPYDARQGWSQSASQRQVTPVCSFSAR